MKTKRFALSKCVTGTWLVLARVPTDRCMIKCECACVGSIWIFFNATKYKANENRIPVLIFNGY